MAARKRLTYVIEEDGRVGMAEFTDESALLLHVIFGQPAEYVFGFLGSFQPHGDQLWLCVVSLRLPLTILLLPTHSVRGC